MEWLLGIAAVSFAFWFFTRPREDPRSEVRFTLSFETKITSVENGPDNPRFSNWEEALNRPVTDELLFRIEYCDRDGVLTTRDIVPKKIHLRPGRPEIKITAHCYLRDDERTFHSERILAAQNLKTGRAIKDLSDYLRRKY